MKKLHVFSPWQRPQAFLFRELLEKEGIACQLRNAQLASALGEIPFTECYPELWVLDDEVYPRARLLLDGWLKTDGPTAPLDLSRLRRAPGGTVRLLLEMRPAARGGGLNLSCWQWFPLGQRTRREGCPFSLPDPVPASLGVVHRHG